MNGSLVAVLAADVAGYSKLMDDDAKSTLVALKRLRTEIFGPVVASRRGRVVKNMGDGWIVLFGAATDIDHLQLLSVGRGFFCIRVFNKLIRFVIPEFWPAQQYDLFV